MAWQPQGPAPLPNFREWVPDWLRVPLYVLLLIGFQWSNGMYFTAFEQMKGGLSITQSDVVMMGQTVLIGLSFYFPLAFRLKFRFQNKWSLFAAACGQIVCNLLFPHLTVMPLRLLVCYAGGFFRLYGTFECFSNILGRVTPTYNYAVFLSFVFFIVIGCVNVIDIAATQLIYHYDWQMLHTFSVGYLLFMLLLILVFWRTFRPMPKMPLLGISWIGMATWSIFILSLVYVAAYGEELGWLHHTHIRVALCMASLSLAYGIWAMYNRRHPFICREAFQLRHFWVIMAIFLLLCILLATQHVLQATYFGAFLHLDVLASARMKWFDFLGQALGALFCWQVLVRKLIRPKYMMLIAFSCIGIYLLSMQQLLSYQAPTSAFCLPLVVCGFGHVMVFIVLTVYVQATANFTYYFQMLCLLGFVRTGVGDPLGEAIWERGLHALIPYNGLLDSLRELYGWAFLVCVIALLVILITRFSFGIRSITPRLRSIYHSASLGLQHFPRRRPS